MLKNRKIKCIFALIMLLLLIIEPVFAINCNGLLTPGAYKMLQDAINIIRIVVPILLIILGSVDFGSVVLNDDGIKFNCRVATIIRNDDKDALKKATGKFVKRCIAAVAIFFVPIIVKTLLNLPGIKGNINLVDDPMCGIK